MPLSQKAILRPIKGHLKMTRGRGLQFVYFMLSACAVNWSVSHFGWYIIEK
jgi:hypothetical protein